LGSKLSFSLLFCLFFLFQIGTARALLQFVTQITKNKETIMKSLLAGLFTSLLASSAFAQTATSSSAFTIPTKIPSGAVTPKGVAIKDLRVDGTCGSAITIQVSIQYDVVSATKVLVWGNFAQKNVDIPAGKGMQTVSFTGNKLDCDFLNKGNPYAALDVYAGVGDTQAMRTIEFGAPGAKKLFPASAVNSSFATPKGVFLQSMNAQARCGEVSSVVATIAYNTTSKTTLHLDTIDSTKEIDIPAGNGTLVAVVPGPSISESSKLDCKSLSKLDVALAKDLLMGTTERMQSTGKDSAFAIGAVTTLLPK
jgi:hypothetical protein